MTRSFSVAFPIFFGGNFFSICLWPMQHAACIDTFMHMNRFRSDSRHFFWPLVGFFFSIIWHVRAVHSSSALHFHKPKQETHSNLLFMFKFWNFVCFYNVFPFLPFITNEGNFIRMHTNNLTLLQRRKETKLQQIGLHYKSEERCSKIFLYQKPKVSEIIIE